MRLRVLAVVPALSFAFVGCGDEHENALTPEPAPAASAPAAAPASVEASQAAPRFDLKQVVERARSSFRREGTALVGGRASYAVSASEGRVSIRPMTRESRSNARRRPHEPAALHRPQPVVGAALELETVAAGRRGGSLELGARPEVTADGAVELAARDVVERLESRDQGLELSFRFAARPRGTGDLELRVRASGLEPAGETPSGFHFRDPGTGLGLRIGVATWVDANGERTPVAERFDGNELTLVVSADTLERSSFPATLDPVIGPERGVDTPVTGPASADQSAPTVAYSGGSYLAVWTDDRSGLNTQVFATRISSAGAVLDPKGIAVTALGQYGYGPGVTWDGTNFLVAWVSGDDALIYGRRVATTGALVDTAPFAIQSAASGADGSTGVSIASAGATALVVWEDFRSGAGSDIFGARVTGSTSLDPNGIPISTATNDQDAPAVAYNGTSWQVVWEDFRSGSQYDVYGSRVSTAGAVLDSASTGIAISAGASDENRPKVASNGSASLVVWEDQRNSATAGTQVFAARVSAAGAVLDPAGLQLSTATNGQYNPGVAYDGTSYTVAWLDGAGGFTGNRVSAAGALLNGASGAALTGSPGAGIFAGDLGVFAAGSATYIAWDQTSGGASNYDAYGSRLSTTLALLDAPGLLLSSGANGEKEVGIAAGGEGQWLVVWHDDRNNVDGIYAARLDAQGNSLDSSGILLSAGAFFPDSPSVGWNGANYLVVWHDQRGGVYGTRVNPVTGAVLDPAGLPLFTGGGISPFMTNVTSDGANWLVSWSDFRSVGRGIYAGRVSPAGATLDPGGIAVRTGVYTDPPRTAFGGGNYLVVWLEYQAGGGNNLFGVRLSRAGVKLDATPIEVTTGTTNSIQNGGDWSVAWVSPSFMIVYSNHGIIQRARVNPATGAVLDTGVALTSVCCSYAPTVALDGSTALVIYEAQVGNDYQLRGTRLTPAGVDLDATDFTVASGSGVSFDVPGLAGSPEGTMLAFGRYDATTGITSMRLRVQQVSSVPVFPLIQSPPTP